MLRRVSLRLVSRAVVPHAVFEPEHPMLKEDAHIRHLKHLKHTGQLKLPEPDKLDISTLEYNAHPVKLYEVSAEERKQFPDQVDTYSMVFLHYNYPEIDKMLARVQPLDFDSQSQRLPEARHLTYSEMMSAKEAALDYVLTRFCPPDFHHFVDLQLAILPVDGSVLPMKQQATYEETWQQLFRMTHLFFHGAGMFLTPSQRWRYRADLLTQAHNGEFLDRRELPTLTKRETAFLLGQENWVYMPESTEDDYSFCLRPEFKDFDHYKEINWAGSRKKGSFWGQLWKWRIYE